MIPDEPGVLAVVMFADDIFKYASSVVRHFPSLCPPDESGKSESGAPSKNEQLLAAMIENLKNPYDSIKADDLREALASEARPAVVDIRGTDMYADGHIEGSLNIPQDDLPTRASELPTDRDAEIVMVCNIGKFSKYTTLLLKSMGYRNVKSVKGGLNEWVRKGHPTSPGRS
jgi:rhodanese-related sulfurtransferase